jgi:hypothetical protein
MINIGMQLGVGFLVDFLVVWYGPYKPFGQGVSRHLVPIAKTIVGSALLSIYQMMVTVPAEMAFVIGPQGCLAYFVSSTHEAQLKRRQDEAACLDKLGAPLLTDLLLG